MQESVHKSSGASSEMCLALHERLPTELLISILFTLDVANLLRCRLIHSFFKELIDASSTLQYNIALHVTGMENGPSSAVSPRQRLDILRQQQYSWSKLAWTSRTRVAELEGAVWELYGNVLGQGKDDNALRFFRLPSIHRGIPPSDPWEIKVDFTIRDFAMDPSQDLLVLLEVWRSNQPMPNRWRSRIHFVSLATGERHKEAAQYPEVSLPYFNSNWSYTIQTCGQYAGVLYSPPSTAPARDCLVVFNWCTGVQYMQFEDRDLDSFAFLSPPHLLLGICVTHGVDDFGDDAPPPPWRSPSLDIIAFADTAGHPFPDHAPRPLGGLLYPQLQAATQPFALSIRTDPGVPWAPASHLSVPFHVARAERIFVIRFYVFAHEGARPVLSFVPLAVLDAHAARLAAAAANQVAWLPRAVSWADWGPTGSCMLLDEPVSDVWVCHVFGTRFASSRSLRRGVIRITLRDFNQRSYEHGRHFQPVVSPDADDAERPPSVAMPGGFELGHRIASPEDHRRVQGPLIPEEPGAWEYIGPDEQELLRPDELFAEPVQTRLPYRSLTKNIPKNGDSKVAVQLAEDSILLVHLGEIHSGRRYIEVLTF